MNELVFSGYGIEIVRRDGHLYISYDSGGIASWIKEDQITEEEAREAAESPEGASRVILKCVNRAKE